ncbi:MAG: class I SAM-dependent methyltransferase [Actinobacteria bacterium]|nr:class I SAM-dependent methyltransferase [Actinomycetota bacterium]
MEQIVVKPFDEVLTSVADVEGWMSPDQARRLYDAARTAAPGQRIVEIGSFRGRSMIVLASAAEPGVELVAIDPHAGNDRGPQEIEGFVAEAQDDHAVFNRNLAAAGVADRVRHVRSFSDAALVDVPGSVQVLYVDGAHRFAPARADIRDWGNRVEPGGTMLIHDSFSSVGVTLAILRELMWSSQWRYVGRARSMTEYRRDLPAGLGAKVTNALRQLAQLPWFVKNLGIKVLMSAKLGGLLSKVTGRPAEWPY